MTDMAKNIRKSERIEKLKEERRIMAEEKTLSAVESSENTDTSSEICAEISESTETTEITEASEAAENEDKGNN